MPEQAFYSSSVHETARWRERLHGHEVTDGTRRAVVEVPAAARVEVRAGLA